MSLYSLYHADCFDIFPAIPDNSIDCIIVDLPYGVTKCKWDTPISLDDMWDEIRRIVKPTTACLFFGTEPFSSNLIMSNIKWFKYEWIWNKVAARGFQISKHRPMQQHEKISVFSYKRAKYNPILTDRPNPTKYLNNQGKSSSLVNKIHSGVYKSENPDKCFPKSIITFSNAKVMGRLHPNEKPLPILEYLVTTHSDENDTVLDFTMGSGSTGHACIKLNRKFIGIEKDIEYYQVAKNRLDSVTNNNIT